MWVSQRYKNLIVSVSGNDVHESLFEITASMQVLLVVTVYNF